ncbi:MULTISPECIES: type II toxin-antitoxin system VapC family toxin [Phyllobacterium]|jgi:ribonuclease VapC|uniref:VapC toxin family PIN domain ribonuclease n=1 Tax=Phyllobacterium sophorae TaxID=1520277 RepID=A0A2P7BLC4_9HYPH|nr:MULTISPECIES: type II toxin-antitoxin system VapC family toxin [Phyllobacterium]PSH67267.1 VapC toxin family PIN domain ribonuclease [Phyllobacterium sophorae]UXN65490.1 type II toxin-antitoxin system VapC family toxin [Phyllobacterium sp. A18/5-2]
MFVDASAMVAMMTDEDDARNFAARLQASDNRMTSPSAVWETAINVARILGIGIAEAANAVQAFLTAMKIQLVSIPPEAAFIAIAAFDRFGKNRHPADLNFGDCFAYACARHYRLPLLYKGNDFSRTDIDAA